MAPAQHTKSKTVIALRPDGGLRLGIVADTHSEPHPGGLRHLRALKPDAILHGGDIGDLSVLETLASIAPVHAVRGNIDHRATLPEVLTVSLLSEGQAQLTLVLTHIAIAGTRIRADAAKLARAAQASIIICGHSHVPFIGQERGLTIFNPGSIGPRRFRLPILFGMMELSSQGVTLQHFDCETGKPWLPNYDAGKA